MRRRLAFVTPAVFALVAAACSDTNAPERSVAPAQSVDDRGFSPASADENRFEGRGVFHRYVAIGTSVSAGVQGDGLIATTQETSWPAQLAAMAGRNLTQPYIAGTGCRPPLVAPLGSGVRLDGEPAGTPPASLSCSPLRDDVTLPVENVAINGALTKDALFTTPENTTDPGNAGIISRVLQPGMTQVSTMVGENPKLVSVELGANEVLGARSGVAIEGVSMFPYEAWVPLYDALLNQVDQVAQKAVVVGLIDDIAEFPGIRTGNEMWGQRLQFAGAFNVNVADDCNGSPNLIFVPIFVPTAVATGAYYKAHTLGPYTMSCAGGGPTTEDNILTPSEAAAVNSLLTRMNAHIKQQARRHHFAHFALEALYGRRDLKAPFDVIALMTTPKPYGLFISIDGTHPSGEGARILAEAAARALDDRYDLHIHPGYRTLIASR